MISVQYFEEEIKMAGRMCWNCSKNIFLTILLQAIGLSLCLEAPYLQLNRTKEEYELPELPYENGYHGLAPYIEADTLTAHHSGHHATYTKNLNAALKQWRESVGVCVVEIMIPFICLNMKRQQEHDLLFMSHVMSWNPYLLTSLHWETPQKCVGLNHQLGHRVIRSIKILSVIAAMGRVPAVLTQNKTKHSKSEQTDLNRSIMWYDSCRCTGAKQSPDNQQQPCWLHVLWTKQTILGEVCKLSPADTVQKYHDKCYNVVIALCAWLVKFPKHYRRPGESPWCRPSLFKALGKNIDFRLSFSRYSRKKVKF